MALQIETIRATADRVAASHRLAVVELEFTGGAKHRTLRVFLEKDAAMRAAMAAAAAAHATADAGDVEGADEAALTLPRGVPVEQLSFLTHEDCAAFATDFGTVLDVEDLIPGAEYTLEVSSPGLERKLLSAADYTRFTGSLAKVHLFAAVQNNRHFTGRIVGFAEGVVSLDLSAVKQKGKNKKAPAQDVVALALGNIEKANLIAEM